MTAWQILIAGSTLSNGTAWDHLNAQGGGVADDIFIYGEVEVDVLVQQFEVEMPGECEVELVDDLTVEIDDEFM